MTLGGRDDCSGANEYIIIIYVPTYMTRIIRRYFIIIISRVKIKTQGHFCLLRVQGGTR